MAAVGGSSRRAANDLAFLGVLALGKVLLHLPFLGRYGLYGDEYYFLACGARLDFGYADHPPFVPLVAAVARYVFGDSVIGLRAVPCFAGALTVLLAGLLCRELGGRRWAQGLTALGLVLAPFFLRTGNLLTIPSFEPCFWMLGTLLVLRIVHAQRPRLWLAFGAVAGLGLLNKHSMLIFGFAVMVGLLVTRHRRQLASRWFWLGGAVAALVFAPNLVWQMQHDWATVRFLRNLNETVMAGLSRTDFFLGQVLYAGPFFAPVWMAGLAFLLARRERRFLGWIFVVVLVVLLAMKSKIYYSLPIYPLVFAAGAVFWERCLPRTGWRAAFTVVLTVGGVGLAPMALPVLPIDKVDRYAEAVTFGLAGKVYEITGDLHAMFGWEEQAEGVSAVCESLAPADRERVVLLARSYSQAGALEYHGRRLGLPPVLCNHLSYHFWSAQWLQAHEGSARSGDVVLALSVSRRALERLFEEVELRAVIAGSPYANPWERDQPLYLCRRPRKPLAELWPREMSL